MRKDDYTLFVYCKMPLFRWGMKSRSPLFIEVSWKEFVFLPMDEVGAHGMAPVHILPIALIGIMLIEKMILTIMPDKSVGVVDPSATGGEVKLRTVCLMIDERLVGDGVGLTEEVGILEVVRHLNGDFLPFKILHILEYPVIGGAVGEADIEGYRLPLLGTESHPYTVDRMRHREMKIAVLNLHSVFRPISGGE